jgi:transketolase
LPAGFLLIIHWKYWECGSLQFVDSRSKTLREKVLYVAHHGKRGHLPSAMSLLEILRVLYDNIFDFDVSEPWMATRDRLILSKGHGCIALYVLLQDKGFFDLKELEDFCKFDGKLGGHPEYRVLPGIESSTGSLGHGAAFGVGHAYASRLLKKDYRVWVVMGDGEMNEGSVWESLMAAAHHELANINFIIDANGKQASGDSSSIWNLGNLKQKIEAFGINSFECDGHDLDELEKTFKEMILDKKPSCLIARTTKGKGILKLEAESSWHHKSAISNDEVEMLKNSL